MDSEIHNIRNNFPITKEKIFMNHAAYSPLPKPVVDIMRKYNDDLCRYEIDNSKYSLGQDQFAKLVSAEKEEIALVQNTSTGLNIVANMLEYKKHSNIVTTDLEYPSVVYPWLNKRLALEVKYVNNIDGKILIEDVEKAVDDNTVAIAVSHVEYVNGFKHNLRELADIAHEHDAYLVVDAIQSLGALPIDVDKENVDFLTASCYKWLLGPAGAGYLYVRKELIEKFIPPFIGWASVKPEVFETIEFWDICNCPLSETASRFEVGCPSFISFIGASAAIQILLDTGIDKIQKRIIKLTNILIDELHSLNFHIKTPEDPNHRSGIVHFLIKNAKTKAKSLEEKRIIISARSNGIRVAPHFYNTEEEIRCLIERLKDL